ncbi:hypothetical protein BDP81DRAFT_433942, partial [Colletotrichum phormii]
MIIRVRGDPEADEFRRPLGKSYRETRGALIRRPEALGFDLCTVWKMLSLMRLKENPSW